MAEGKVGSLFVEFKTNLSQFVADMQRMVSEVRSFDANVRTASKTFSDLGHLGHTTVSEVINDLGRLTSGLSTANRFAEQTVKGISDIGHLGSPAIKELTNDLGGLTAGLSTANRFAEQTAKGVSDIGHLGSASVREFTNDLGGLTAGLGTANRFAAQTAIGISDIGHLGGAGVKEFTNDLGGLTAGLSTANRFAQQTVTGIGDLGHLGSTGVKEFTNDLGGLTAGLSTANRFAAQTASGISDIGHLGTTGVKEAVNDLGGLAAGLGTANRFAAQTVTGISDIGHLGSPAIKEAVNDLGGLTSGLGTANRFAAQVVTGVSDLGHLGGAAINGASNATATFGDRIRQASSEMRQFDRVFAPIQRRLNEIGIAMSVGLTAPIIAAGAFAIKVGIDFETSFSKVRQVLDANEAQFAILRKQLIDLSTTAPTSAAQFAEIAASAAKLGIEAPDIEKFARTVNELSAVTNLSADAASNFLARFTNLTHLPQDQIHDLGATVFALGKAFPGLETEIGNFALRVARTGTFVNLTSGQILAFATALSSVGVSAESGGTALSTTLAEMAKASQNLDSIKLAQFANVAGQSAADFAKSFKTDAAGAVLDFVRGLQRIKDQGGDVFTTLEHLGLGARRTRETILALASGDEQLARALEIAADQLRSNGEFTRAYGEKVKTTQSQLDIFKHSVEALGISLFDAIGPVINGTVLPALKQLVDEGLKPALQAFQDMTPGSQHFVEGMVIIAAGAGPAILAITKLISFVEGLTILLKKEVGLELFTSIYAGLKETVTLAGIAYGERGLGGIIGVLARPLAVPWWLEAATYAGLVLEVYNLAHAYSDLVDAEDQANKARAGADNAVFESAKAFQKRGIDISLTKTVPEPLNAFTLGFPESMRGTIETSKSVEELRKQLTELGLVEQAAAHSAQRMAQFQASAANTGKEYGAASQLTAEELEAQRKAAEDLAKEHERLIEKFTSELIPASELNKELSFLLKYFSEDEVLAVYGKRIVDATEAQRAHGIAVSGATARLYDQAKAIETAHDRLKELLKEISKEPVPTFDMMIAGGLPGLQTPTNALELKGLNDFDKGKKEITELGEAIRNLSFLGPDKELGMFSGDLDKAEKFAKDFRLQLEPDIQALIDLKSAMKESEDGTKKWKDAANEGLKAIDDMATQISAASKSVADLDALGLSDADILAILGDAIDKAAKNAKILHTELGPLLDRLAKLQKQMKDDSKEASELAKEMRRVMTEVTAKIVNDLSQGIADALLGSKSLGDLGKKLGEDFAAAFIKAAVAHIASTLTKKLTDAAAAHPVVAAVVVTALVVAAVVRSLSNSHLFANEFVKETQNPLGKSLSQVVDAQNALFAAGRQTYQGAQEAEAKVNELWNGFIEDAQKFGEQGRKQATVANQAIETLSPTFKRVIFNIQQQIEALKPPSVRAVESVNALAAYRTATASLTADRIKQLQEEASSINDQIHYVMQQIDVQEELGGSTKELNAELQELIYKWDDVQTALHPVIPTLYTFAEAVKAVSTNLVPDKTLSFLDQVLNATSGSANLEEALGVLESIGTPVAIIIDRLGSDVENFTHALELSGQPIPPLIQKYLRLKEASDNASKDMPRIANSLSKLVGDAVDKLRKMAGGGDLAKSILDALAALLVGLPNQSTGKGGITATMDVGVRDAVDKVRTVTESILATLKTSMPAAADTRTVSAANVAQDGYIHIGQWPGPNVAPAVQYININIEDNEVINNDFAFTMPINRETVRDVVIPEIEETLNNNTDSRREKWTRILRGAGMGVTAR